MSEYWVSHKKYFCKYCNIYIADDAPSRRQHETGLRHKGNVERFVRGLYKAGEKRKQDLEEEKREMVRVDQAAQAAYAQDVSAGLVKPGSSSTSIALKPAVLPKPAARSSDPYANYTTAQSLGITDPDEERAKAEAERRRTEGVAGEWQFVPVETTPPVEEVPSAASTSSATEPTELRLKREAPVIVDEEDTRSFRFKKKRLGAGLGEIYDPGPIPIKLKTKKEESPSNEGLAGLGSVDAGPSGPITPATSVPRWSARGWKKPTDRETTSTVTNGTTTVKEEVSDSSSQVKGEPLEQSEPALSHISTSSSKDIPSGDIKVEDVKSEEIEPPSTSSASFGGLFKKRKIRAGGNAGNRGRRL
ncbi:unnamed protein product [Somion occarium]|uniref:Matrin-type domain-containing protein n=1 Tax=Somion occarium TaxID=3059160 RepID=A0ABP1DIM5_9APHY